MDNTNIEFPAPSGDFLKYPKHKVIALMDDPESVRRAVNDLVDAGFPQDKIDVLSGPEGAGRLDVGGRHHGLNARIYRLVERLSDTDEWLQCHSHHLAHNGYGVSVSAVKRTKAKAMEILSTHGAHDAAYFGKAHWESV